MITSVKVYNMSGEVIGEQQLPPQLFAVRVKPDVVHQVVIAQAANRRMPIAHTKTKGEVRGGGRKPWRQKGTGRARQGSIRNPQWRGGGVAFGPRANRNFTQKVNVKMKRAALAMVLSDKLVNNRIVVVDRFELPEGKTKHLRTLLSHMPSADHRVLLSMGSLDRNMLRAARNLPVTSYCAADSLNVIDLLNSEYLLLDKGALERIEQRFKR